MTKQRSRQLSVRQWECLALAAQHRSAKEIARALGITASTVNDHLDAAIMRLDATDRRDAARMFSSGEAGPPLDGIRGDFLRVVPMPVSQPLVVTEDAIDTSDLKNGVGKDAPIEPLVPFHFLRGERQSNELRTAQRLERIIKVAVACLIGFAMTVVIIDRLTSIVTSSQG